MVVRSNSGLIVRGHRMHEMTRGDRWLRVYAYTGVLASRALHCTELIYPTGVCFRTLGLQGRSSAADSQIEGKVLTEEWEMSPDNRSWSSESTSPEIFLCYWHLILLYFCGLA